MSSEADIRVVKVREPRTDLKSHSTFAVLEGAKNITSYQINATSSNQSNATFNIPIPSDRAALDRVAMIKIPFTATITANAAALTAAGQPIWVAGNDAVRAYPISAICQNLTANINGVSVNIQPYLATQPLARFDAYQRKYLGTRSVAPDMTDTVATYRGAGGIGTGGSGDGILNPLAVYSSMSMGSMQPRGMYSGIQILTNQSNGTAANTCTISGVLYEAIPIAPFIDDEDNQSQALANIKTLSLQFTWQNLSRIFSHSLAQNASAPYTQATNPWGAVAVSLGLPTMLVNFLTLKDSQEIPHSIYYPYSQVQVYPTSGALGASLAPGSSTTLTSNNIQLQNIPRKMYIYSRISDSQVLGVTDPNKCTFADAFLPISNLNVTWNNQTSLFSQADIAQLYDMSVSNGYSKSFSQFQGITQVNSTAFGTAPYNVALEGGVICVTFGKDIALSGDEYSGKTGTFNLQVKATVTNQDPLNTTSCFPDLFIMTVTDSVLAMEQGQTKVFTGIGHVDVETLPMSSASYQELTKVYGGSFWDSLKSVLAPIHDVVKESKLASTLVSAIPGIGPIASNLVRSLGYGEMAQANMQQSSRGGVLAGSARGKALGGKAVSRKML